MKRTAGSWTIWAVCLLIVLMGGLWWGCVRQQEDGLFSLVRTPRVSGPVTRERQEALALYHDAWQAVFNEYVDEAFNGQDWYRWKDRYNQVLQNKADAYAAIKTMLASLNDPYTRFLEPRKAEDQDMHIESRLSGVGIQIAVKDNQIVVITALDDTPAKAAGIMPLDKILAVDGQPTADLSIDDVVNKIRGPEGTPVNLTIGRNNQRLAKRLVRAKIVIKTVFGEPVSKDIGYIRLTSFISQDAPREMMEKLNEQRYTRAMILDIRGNNGGLLPNALEISNMFYQGGEIVSIADRNGNRKSFFARKAPLYNKPLVVLIDEGSASASEILSGALKDNNRAVLIGSKTFGKGLVQKIHYLSDGSEINLTISKYYTPAGHDIDRKGIAPNIEVPYTVSDFQNNRDPQKDAAIRYLKKQLLARAS